MIREIVINSDALNLDMCQTACITLHIESIQPEPASLNYSMQSIKDADTGMPLTLSDADLQKVRAYVRHTAEQYLAMAHYEGGNEMPTWVKQTTEWEH